MMKKYLNAPVRIIQNVGDLKELNKSNQIF
jgi:hypothetical protein